MFKYIIIFLFVIHFIYGQDTDFCSEQYSCRSNEKLRVNSICELNHNCGIGPNCVKFERHFLNEADKKALLDKNNELRNMHALGNGLTSTDNGIYSSAANMRELVWDEDLEYQAQCWANQCPTIEAACVMKADTTIANQNTAWSSEDDILNMTQTFYNEGVNADTSIIDEFVPPIGRPVIKHFVQLIWANTMSIGCGRSKYYNNKTKQLTYCLVCNYAIKGNMEESEIYITGPPCSKCPEGTECHPTYKGLCTIKPSISKASDYCKYSSDAKNCKSPFEILGERENLIIVQAEEINNGATEQSKERNNTTQQSRGFYTKTIRQEKIKAASGPNINFPFKVRRRLKDGYVKCRIRSRIIIIDASAGHGTKLRHDLIILSFIFYICCIVCLNI